MRLAELHKLIPPCCIPDGRVGDWYIETREITPEASAELAALHVSHGHEQYVAYSPPGRHKFLGYPRYDAVMNDTLAELELHETFVRAATGKVLITGLGMGLLPAALLRKPDVTRIEIVELEPDVIALVRPHLQDERIAVHQGDAYTFEPATQFDFAWHDLLYWNSTMSAAIRRLREHYRSHALAQFAWGEGTAWWR